MYTKTKQIKEIRNKRAVAIAEESGYSKLSTKEKLARVMGHIAAGLGNAAKERAKLEALLLKEQAKKEAVKPPHSVVKEEEPKKEAEVVEAPVKPAKGKGKKAKA